MVAPEVSKVAADGAARWLVTKVNTEELPRLARLVRPGASRVENYIEVTP
jgi:hypothetical protein